MPRFGGPGRKKQCCELRRCLATDANHSSTKENVHVSTLLSCGHNCDPLFLSVHIHTHTHTHAHTRTHTRTHTHTCARTHLYTHQFVIHLKDFSQSNEDATKFLAGQNRQIVPMLQDGNCMFRSVAHQLIGDAEQHDQLRHATVIFAAQNGEVLRLFTLGMVMELLH